jgi:flagellar protein FliS
MSGNNYGLNKYKQTSITTASRGQIIIMLYEGCLKFLRKALDAMAQNNIAEKGMYIGKAQDIINELNNSLNHDVGGDLTKELERLYDYMFEQTTQANMNNDPQGINTTMKLLETLLDGWREAVAKSGNIVMTPQSDGSSNGQSG